MSSKAKRNFIANPGVIWVFLQLSWASCITFIMMWEQLCSAVEQYTQHLPQMMQCPLSSPHTYMESFASVLLEAKIQLCIYSEEFQVWRNAYPAPPEANASPHADILVGFCTLPRWAWPPCPTHYTESLFTSCMWSFSCFTLRLPRTLKDSALSFEATENLQSRKHKISYCKPR